MWNGRYLLVGAAVVLGVGACSGSVITENDEPSFGGASNGIVAGAAGSNHTSPAGGSPNVSGGAPVAPPHAGASSGGGRSGSDTADGGAAGGGECMIDGVTHRTGVGFACDCNTCWYDSDCTLMSTGLGCPEGGATGEGGAQSVGGEGGAIGVGGEAGAH